MKKYIYILAAVAALAACSKEVATNEENQNQPAETGVRTVTFTATLESPETKGTIDKSTGTFTWSATDQVAVWTSGTGAQKRTATATNISGDSAEFSFTLGEGENIEEGAILVYPADRLTAAGTVNFDPKVFDPSAAPAVEPILAAEVGSDRNTLTFKYVCGTIQLTISDIPSIADNIWIQAQNSGSLGGSYSITFSESNPSIQFSSTSDAYTIGELSGGSKTIVMPVPATGNRQFYFSVKQGNVELFYKMSPSLNVQRTSYFKMANLNLPVYTVAGSKNGDDTNASIFGTPWAPSNSDNDMIITGANTYEKVYSNVTIGAGVYGKLSIAYKIVKDHSWDESYGYGEGNFTFTSSEYKTSITGDVVITFNSSTHESTCSFVPANDVYFVYGDFSGSWEYSAANQLVDNGSGVYTKDFTIDAAKTVNFKIVKNHTFDTSWPLNNFEYNVLKAGTFTVTFNPATKDIYAWDSSTYAVAGSSADIFGAAWNTTDKQLTRQADGTFKVEIPVSVSSDTPIEFKVVANSNWDTSYPSGNVSATITKDNSLLTITYSPYDHQVSYSIN